MKASYPITCFVMICPRSSTFLSLHLCIHIFCLSTMSGPLVLEPTAEELASFRTSEDGLYHPLHAISKWAGFTWGTKYLHSPGAVLLTNLGSDWVASQGAESLDPKVPTMAVDEFASTPTEELERNIEGPNGSSQILPSPWFSRRKPWTEKKYAKRSTFTAAKPGRRIKPLTCYVDSSSHEKSKELWKRTKMTRPTSIGWRR